MNNLENKSLLHGDGNDFILINSATKYFSESNEKSGEEVLPPLGLALLLTYALQQADLKGSLLDMEEHRLSINKTAAIVNSFPATKVGINLFTPNRQVALTVASKLDEDKELILGGPHVTALPEHTLKEFVQVHKNTVILPGSVGNVENSFVEFMTGDKSLINIPGVQWIKNGIVEKSKASAIHKHFGESPMIDRSFMAPAYIDHRNNQIEAAQITSVNCPFNCSFCSGASRRHGIKTERRTTEQILDEMSILVSQYGAKSIRFVDDLLLSSQSSIHNLLKAIEKVSLSPSSMRGNGHVHTLIKMGNTMLSRLAESRFSEIAIGIESASPHILELMRKPHAPEDAKTLVQTLNNLGIMTKGFFIIGYPGETQDETLATVSLARKMRTESMGMHRNSLFNFFIHPGTEVWDFVRKKGWGVDQLLETDFEFVDGRLENAGRPVAQLAELTPQDLQGIAKEYHEWQLVN